MPDTNAKGARPRGRPRRPAHIRQQHIYLPQTLREQMAERAAAAGRLLTDEYQLAVEQYLQQPAPDVP